MSLKNIQILLETMTRCGGNCSGCALSSLERMTKADIDFTKFNIQQQSTYNYLLKQDYSNIESISIFLGQGDHFLMEDNDIETFVKICSTLVPQEMKHKTVIFITASAIGKHDTIKYKMDLFYKYSLIYEIPFFIQVVFDPKKMLVTENFKNIYMQNILYFKEKCGMTELTINLGQDLYTYISPQQFHDWILSYGFKHIELNWVVNKETHNMWKNSSTKMFSWLKEWLLIYKQECAYEINFIPFLGRSFLNKHLPFMDMKEKIISSLKDNLYIDTQDNLLLGQMGLISNITPIGERLIHNNNQLQNIDFLAENTSKKLIKNILKRPACSNCEYKNICVNSGATAWFDYPDVSNNLYDCPWDIKDFLSFFETHFVQDNLGNLGETRFHKNPVQNSHLLKENNATYLYFDQQSIDINS